MSCLVALDYLLYPGTATYFHEIFDRPSYAIFIIIIGSGVEAIYSYSDHYKAIIDGIGHFFRVGDLSGKMWSPVAELLTFVSRKCGELWTTIRELWTWTWRKLWTKIGELWTNIGELWTYIRGLWTWTWREIRTNVEELWTWTWRGLGNIWTRLWRWIGNKNRVQQEPT
jgi:hypothetical protein